MDVWQRRAHRPWPWKLEQKRTPPGTPFGGTSVGAMIKFSEAAAVVPGTGGPGGVQRGSKWHLAHLVLAACAE